MRLQVHVDEASAGASAADVITSVVAECPHAAIGLATGSSPLALYQNLIERVRHDQLDLRRVSAYTLDEYIGLESGDKRRYRAVIRDDFTIEAGIADASLHSPDVDAPDLEESAAQYEAKLVASGVDVQVLGLGANGHIAFNEPGSAGDTITRVVSLSDRTRADNARFFSSPDGVPTLAISQGIATISRAKRILLIATGGSKREALASLLDGAVDAAWPVSALRRHPRLIVIADKSAAAGLRAPARMMGRHR